MWKMLNLLIGSRLYVEYLNPILKKYIARKNVILEKSPSVLEKPSRRWPENKLDNSRPKHRHRRDSFKNHRTKKNFLKMKLQVSLALAVVVLLLAGSVQSGKLVKRDEGEMRFHFYSAFLPPNIHLWCTEKCLLLSGIVSIAAVAWSPRALAISRGPIVTRQKVANSTKRGGRSSRVV